MFTFPRRHLLNYLKPNEVTKVLFHTRNLCKAAGKIMAASARWTTQGRSPGVRGARSRGIEKVALNEITTATCEPSFLELGVRTTNIVLMGV